MKWPKDIPSLDKINAYQLFKSQIRSLAMWLHGQYTLSCTQCQPSDVPSLLQHSRAHLDGNFCRTASAWAASIGSIKT